MRTTLDIEDDVLLAAKETARRDKLSIGAVISDLARRTLTAQSTQQGRRRETRHPGPGQAGHRAAAALHDTQHLHDREAADWPAAQTRGGWATCPLTQNGCVRILSQPNYPNPVPLADALAVLRRSCGQPSHAFWHDDISLLDTARLDQARVHGHRQITDLCLLALAVEHDGCFVTFDAQIPLSAVRGASPRQLVSI